MILKKKTLSFINILLCFGISACRYALVMSKVAMSFPSCASIISVQNDFSKETVGDEILPPSLRYSFLLRPYVQVLPFILPHILSFIKVTASNAFLLSSKYNIYGLILVTTGFPGMGPLSISPNCFITPATDFSTIFL